MNDTILVLNAGSSSVKFQLFELGPDDLSMRFKGQIEGIGTNARLTAKDHEGASLADAELPADAAVDVGNALQHLFGWLQETIGGHLPVAVGHRVVHGGPDYSGPVQIDEAVLTQLERFVPLAPLHQPNNLLPIREIHERRPDIPQVACFDTAFHRDHPHLADRYALPERLYELGVRRYGFHGLSYEYIARTLERTAPALARGRTVVAHLGSGASMCAIRDGHSIDSTMGFTALDGLPMGTRSGAIDPGVLLFLLSEQGYSVEDLTQLLYKQSGLRGLSGVSNDVRELLASSEPSAKLAMDYFAYRIARELGGLTAAMGGLDGFVFTAGIGERSAKVRGDVCRLAAWLGIDLDGPANDSNGPLISTPESKIAVWVVATDEERMIALHTRSTLSKQ